MSERRRQRAQTALAEARRLLEAGDVRGAVEPLERARADFAAELDLAGVREVRVAAERGYHLADEAGEPFYEQLLYASAQNVRFLSRREAARAGMPWEDPHPELDLPGRPEIRVERGLSRRAKTWLVGVSIAVLVAAGAAIAGIVLSFERATLVNDTGHPVAYGSCNSSGLVDTSNVLEAGDRKRFTGWNLCVTVLDPTTFRHGCIHLHDGETAKASEAKPCD